AEVAHLRAAPSDPALLERVVSGAGALAQATARAADLAGRLARPLDDGIAARSARSAELGTTLAQLADVEAKTRTETAAAAALAQEAEVVVARLGGELRTAVGGGDVDELAAEASASLAEAELAARAARTAVDRAAAAEASLLARVPRRP